jgi:CheY-like chemotaxis protein
MSPLELVVEKGAEPIPALGNKPQLLVVDDAKDVQWLLSRALSFMGYDVVVAGNGLEAMTLFLTSSYDLLITDLQMPLMNGLELSRLVKEQYPKTPVILVTGFCDDKLFEKANMNCFDAVIPKPFNLDEIEKTVQKLLDRGL